MEWCLFFLKHELKECKLEVMSISKGATKRPNKNAFLEFAALCLFNEHHDGHLFVNLLPA